MAGTIAPAQQADVEQIFNRALAAQQRGDLAASIADYQQVLKLAPGLVPALANLAAAQVQTGHPEEAVATYQGALRREPGSMKIALLLADTLISLRRYPDAIEILQPLENIRHGNLEASFLLGEALIHSGKLADGLARVEAFAKARNDGNAWMLAAVTEIKLERYKEAVESADKAVLQDPTLPGVYTLDGMAKGHAGDNQGAIAAYRKALAANPQDFDANLRLGTILLSVEDDPQGAEPYLDRALTLNASSLPARFEVAKLQMMKHDDAAAIANFESIAQENPKLLQPHLQLAILYGRQKRRTESEKQRNIADQLSALATKNEANAQLEDPDVTP